jgi:hypothetical protein
MAATAVFEPVYMAAGVDSRVHWRAMHHHWCVAMWSFNMAQLHLQKIHLWQQLQHQNAIILCQRANRLLARGRPSAKCTDNVAGVSGDAEEECKHSTNLPQQQQHTRDGHDDLDPPTPTQHTDIDSIDSSSPEQKADESSEEEDPSESPASSMEEEEENTSADEGSEEEDPGELTPLSTEEEEDSPSFTFPSSLPPEPTSTPTNESTSTPVPPTAHPPKLSVDVAFALLSDFMSKGIKPRHICQGDAYQAAALALLEQQDLEQQQQPPSSTPTHHTVTDPTCSSSSEENTDDDINCVPHPSEYDDWESDDDFPDTSEEPVADPHNFLLHKYDKDMWFPEDRPYDPRYDTSSDQWDCAMYHDLRETTLFPTTPDE